MSSVVSAGGRCADMPGRHRRPGRRRQQRLLKTSTVSAASNLSISSPPAGRGSRVTLAVVTRGDNTLHCDQYRRAVNRDVLGERT